MAEYYVNINAQDNGDHEVHTTGCSHPPDEGNRKQLGEFESCAAAVAKAKETYENANGCAYCCSECHTG